MRNLLVTSRIKEQVAGRVQIPQQRQSCEHCHKILAGVSAPWGKTFVCGKSGCQLFAQAQDIGVVQTVRPEQLALPPGKFKSWYCGVVIAYEGDKKWTIGLVHDEAKRTTDWVRGLAFEQAINIIDAQKGRIVRKTESQITGYSPQQGPH